MFSIYHNSYFDGDLMNVLVSLNWHKIHLHNIHQAIMIIHLWVHNHSAEITMFKHDATVFYSYKIYNDHSLDN